FPTASGLAIVTLCTGCSSLYSSEPIMNSPAGTITISGHVLQSLKLSFGLRQRFSLPTWVSMPSQRAATGAGGGGCAGGVAIATCSGGAALGGGADGVPPVNLSHHEGPVVSG